MVELLVELLWELMLELLVMSVHMVLLQLVESTLDRQDRQGHSHKDATGGWLSRNTDHGLLCSDSLQWNC